ncbi:MAG: hypothetical protein OEY55_11395 [Acidimicrobiia bacterium]|nr:hypothetical protein [Acidimicrobiia bacterium]MDH5503846.1 hypothetical protein [Acidimicrobiia bacterium]
MADFDNSFKQFLSAWNHHQELRDSGANISSLLDSRMQLDTLRLDLIRTLR